MFRSLRKSIRNRWKQYQKARQAARKAAAKLRAAEAKAAQRRAELKAQIAAAAPLRLVVGASGIFEPGWVATDIDDLNLLAETDWRCLFAPASIEAILAEHVWEHLSESDGLIAAQQCHRFLKPGGHLRLAIPDGYHPDPAYIEHVRIGGSGPGADDHKVLHTYRTLIQMLTKAGFETQLLEYWDEHGTFHATDWDPAAGMVHRSKRFEKRNSDGVLRYTSLIIDGLKP